jgi:hypothetical protein
VSELGITINRSYLAAAVAIAILVIALVYYRPSVFAEVSGVPASLQSWWFRRPITVNVYAEMQNPEKIIGVFPRARFNIQYYGYMSPDFSDVRFEYGYVLPSHWVSINNGQSATVDVELPIAGKGTYTVYMYYGNPNANVSRYDVDYQDIGFAWYSCSEMSYVDPEYGARIPRTCGIGLYVMWVRADGPTYYRVHVAGFGTSGSVFMALLRGRWGINYVNSTAIDFYTSIYKSYQVSNATISSLPGYIDFNIPASGWYTIVVRYSVTWDGVVDIYEVEDLSSGNKFGNAVDYIAIDGNRFRLIPVLWDGGYYSYSVGDAQPVAYVAPMKPTVVWNATIGNAYFEYYVAPRTVTVYLPVTVTVATPVTVTLPPSTTITTTIYVPATTITTWIQLPPTTIYRNVTITVPEFTYKVYTTTVTVPTTITKTVATPITTTVPVTTTTNVGGTSTVTTIWVTTTTTTTYYYYTTTTITSPWIATVVSPYTTVTKTVTTAIPVTTTIYAPITVPVYYTTTVTLVNNGTNTVTTTVNVNATTSYWAGGTYAAVYPVVVGPYGEVTTTTVYWVVKSPYTVTTTVYGGGSLPVAPSYGWLVLLAMIAIIGVAIVYLVRKR